MERIAGKAERKRSQAKGCKGEGSNKQDILSCIPEGDVEGRNGVCDENERRKGAHPVQSLHQPCHQLCCSGRYVGMGNHSR